MEIFLIVIAILCYFCGMIGYLVYLLRGKNPIHRTAWIILLAGAIFHGGAIVLQSIKEGHIAVGSSHQALSFFTWIIVITYLVVQPRINLRILGAFVSPLAVSFMLLSTLLPSSEVLPSKILQSGWVVIHVTTLFTANALFALAFCAGVMYLLQEKQIKRKHLGFLFPRLPSLERLDRINHICLVVGFPLMTIGLITGFGYASTAWKTYWSWDPKEVFALITWLIYAVLLHERLTVGWRGRRAAWLAIFGFLAVLTTFLGVNLFLKGHHTVFVR
jgi:cytochrome c-type biogenesis protein CcsB